MSNLSIHKAALEGKSFRYPTRRSSSSGQPGLVRSILSEDPKAINSKDAVSFLTVSWPALMVGWSNTTSLGSYYVQPGNGSAVIIEFAKFRNEG